MSRSHILLVWFGLLLAGPAVAQLALPGAAPPAETGGAPPAPKAKKTSKRGPKTGAKLALPGLETVVGKPLMLNGESGLLQISGSGDSVQIDKLKLAGEGVADPSQRCVVDIVSETPIKATHVPSDDGLERYEAEIPACPLAFDVLSGAVIVPSQITACVFKAADCQTSPGGLWGPAAATLEPEADAIAKRRFQADNMISKALKALSERAGDSPDAANLLQDQKAFPGQRDDACRAYQKEARLGFCAASLTEARAILLQTRLAALGGPSKAAKDEKPKKKKKAARKPAEAPPAPADAAAPN